MVEGRSRPRLSRSSGGRSRQRPTACQGAPCLHSSQRLLRWACVLPWSRRRSGAGGSPTGMQLPRQRPPSTESAQVTWSFIALYALAVTSTSLLFLAPVLVTLPLKLTSLVGIDEAPKSLALVAGVGALLAMFANPFFGRLSDRTVSRWGMRRPWMVIGLVGGVRACWSWPSRRTSRRCWSGGASRRCSSTPCWRRRWRCCRIRSRWSSGASWPASSASACRSRR